MLVILTEKPSAARNFAKALGGMKGQFQGENYQIVHALGHLYQLPEDPYENVLPEKKQQYKTWSFYNMPWDSRDFLWKKKMIPGSKKTVDPIREALKTASECVIATDVDPSGEGEMLAWEILDALKWQGKTTRMYFTDEAPKSIQKAFGERAQLPPMRQDGDYVKAETRSRWDYLSMQFTRAATLAARENQVNMVIRQGRLKSVMVYLVAEQLAKVKAYEKKPFYEARYRDENGHVYKRKEELAQRKKKPEEVDLSAFAPAGVVVDKREQKSTKPGKLLDLAAMSSILATKGFKAKEVLAVYQKMYEDQIVSYPRTEDKTITPEQFQELLPLVDAIARLVKVDPGLLTHRKPRGTHVKKQGAHGANRPGTRVPKSLESLASYGRCGPAIYELLARNYLAMLAEDYEYEHQVGHIDAHPEFVGTANVPKVMGFRAIFDSSLQTKDAKEEDTEKDGGENLPLGTKAQAFVHEGANPKPQRPTVKWLMARLEKYNVGTGATRTSTLAEVTNDKSKTQLMVEKKGALTMTTIGEVSFALLEGCRIADVKVTEQLFLSMNQVGRFEIPQEQVLATVQELLVHDMERMRINAKTKLEDYKDSQQGAVSEKEKCQGIYQPTGQEVRFSREWAKHRFTDEEVHKLLAGETIAFQAQSRYGKPFRAVGRLAQQTYKNRPFWGFSLETTGAPQGGIPDVYVGHTFTPEQKKLLEAGKTLILTDFYSVKKQKHFTAEVALVEGCLKMSFPRRS